MEYLQDAFRNHTKVALYTVKKYRLLRCWVNMHLKPNSIKKFILI